jgi:hypothetical protein
MFLQNVHYTVTHPKSWSTSYPRLTAPTLKLLRFAGFICPSCSTLDIHRSIWYERHTGRFSQINKVSKGTTQRTHFQTANVARLQCRKQIRFPLPLRTAADGTSRIPSRSTGHARVEVFTALTMKNVISWDVTPRGSCMNRCFGGTYRFHHQGGK